MFAPLMLTIPVLVAPLLQTPATRDCRFERVGDPVADARAVEAFTEAADAFADLHRIFDRGLPPEWMDTDPAQAAIAAAELAAMLRDARPNARPGDFFKPVVAGVIRFRLANAVREDEFGLAAIAAGDDEEDSDRVEWPRPAVNRQLPWGVTGIRWLGAAYTLPALPQELEYRFVGRDLLLLDIRANLVLDILDKALPEPPAPAPARGGVR
jgi:hypothetical protein